MKTMIMLLRSNLAESRARRQHDDTLRAGDYRLEHAGAHASAGDAVWTRLATNSRV